MKRFILLSAALVVLVVGSVVIEGCAPTTFGQDASTVILDMDTVRHEPTAFTNKDKQKVPVGTVELVDGKFGKACKFTFVDGARSGFFTAWKAGDASWDAAAGISFWVKGDGSQGWGGIELIDRKDYGKRYAYCFPIDSTEWRKIVIPWRDLIPEIPKGDLVDAKTGYKPSGFANVWFGKWFYWRDYPAHSFTIDQVALEKTIPVDEGYSRGIVPGVSRVLAKLKAKKPVTIVTMGDSLSDKRHWANRKQLWSEMLVAELKKKYGGEVRLVNPAIGGTQLTQNLILMPRWLKGTPKPDLVTVCFGYNDWSSGMRGEAFKVRLRYAVDRIRRETKGASDVLLMTTCPANKRWHTMDELAQAVRDVATEKKTGLADIAAEFHKVERDDADTALEQGYWARDKTHLGPQGHEIFRDTVLKAIEGAR